MRSSYSFETLYHCEAAHLTTSGCIEFGPLNTKESDVLAQNVFSQKWIIKQLWNLYHWPSKYKGKCMFHAWKPHTALVWLAWVFRFGLLNTKESDVLAQNVFSQKQIIIQLWNLYHCNWHAWKPQRCRVWPSKYKRKWCFSPKCVFSEMWSYSFETCTIGSSTPENLRVHWVCPSEYKRKWCFSPKCVFSEMDH